MAKSALNKLTGKGSDNIVKDPVAAAQEASRIPAERERKGAPKKHRVKPGGQLKGQRAKSMSPVRSKPQFKIPAGHGHEHHFHERKEFEAMMAEEGKASQKLE